MTNTHGRIFRGRVKSRLIAAAPDLLEAAKFMINSNFSSRSGDMQKSLNNLEKAIKKAEGRE